MTKENRNLVISSLILLVVGIIFIVLYTSKVPVSVEDKIFGIKIELKEDKSADEIDDVVSYIAYQGSKEVGRVYKATTENAFGNMDFYIGIDNNDLIYITPIDIEQAHYQIEDMNFRLLKFLSEHYRGATREEVENYKDFNIGTIDSAASMSSSDVHSFLKNILKLHFNDGTVDPLEDAFGDYTTTLKDENELSGNITKIENILVGDKVVGYRYEITDEGEYESWDGIHEGKITISLTYKIDGGNIVLVEALDEGYGHTISYKKHVDEYLENFNNTNVYNLDETLANTELSASASGSTELAKKMLLELSEAIRDPLYLEFGNYEIVRQEDLEDEFYEVVEHIVVEGEVVGYRYQLVDKGDFKRGGTEVKDKKITLIIIYNLETGNIIDLYAPEGEDYYEHSTGTYKNYVDEYLDLLVDKDINELLNILSSSDMAPDKKLETSSTGGAKYSKSLVKEMLEKLYNDKIKEGE